MKKFALLGICILALNIFGFGQPVETKLNASEKAYILLSIISFVSGLDMCIHTKVNWNWIICRLC